MDFSIFDTLLPEPTTDHKQCCSTPDDRESDGFVSCVSCGAVKRTLYTLTYSELCQIKYKQYYKRISYFREKLKLLGNIKYSNNPDYTTLINRLTTDKLIVQTKTAIKGMSDQATIIFLNKTRFVKQLKKKIFLMKRSKFYKYIYNIILDTTGFKCFHIRPIYLHQLSMEWTQFEMLFKKTYPNTRNMISYNVILKLFLQKYNIKNHELITLPKNSKTIYEKLNRVHFFQSDINGKKNSNFSSTTGKKT